MEIPRLIQRLEQPWPNAVEEGIDNPFSFGGGLRNGGLTKGAMDLLRPIFAFDYMGAAEFEFGAVPKALHYMQLHSKDFVAATTTIEGREVFTLTRKDEMSDVHEFLGKLARNEGNLEYRLHDPSFFPAHFETGPDLMNSRKYRQKTIGWLSLYPSFMFFVSKSVWKKTAKLFEIKKE